MGDDTVELTCEACGRTGDVKPRVVDAGSHLVAIEKTDGGILIQWQAWDGHWFCHVCLADYASDTADEAAAHYPESVAAPEADSDE